MVKLIYHNTGVFCLLIDNRPLITIYYLVGSPNPVLSIRNRTSVKPVEIITSKYASSRGFFFSCRLALCVFCISFRYRFNRQLLLRKRLIGDFPNQKITRVYENYCTNEEQTSALSIR